MTKEEATLKAEQKRLKAEQKVKEKIAKKIVEQKVKEKIAKKIVELLEKKSELLSNRSFNTTFNNYDIELCKIDLELNAAYIEYFKGVINESKNSNR